MASDNDNDPELEYSPLCGPVSRDELTVHVQIYRIAGLGEGWVLEAVDHKGGSTVWNESFATDQVAIEVLRDFRERGHPVFFRAAATW